MASVCSQCSYNNPLGSNFCSSCGSELIETRGDDTEAIDPTIDAPMVMDDAPPSTAMLVVRQGPKRGSRISLDGDSTLIGRHPESDVFLDDITVSRRHAEVARTATGYDVIDAGSLNGTYVNRGLVERAPLSDGDVVQVGKFKLVFVALEGDEG